jgi:eukaryotic-like serine/threonine-protein kinase
MERIGEYLIHRLVGEGGMGKVFEAEERLSKRRVALKVLRPELARSEEARRLFMGEMTILAHLDHPNVVRCLACSEIDGDLIMALELLEGATLREVLIERGRLGWAEAVGVVVQIASALRAAHHQAPPIVHRDLKPENVIVMDDGKVKVMDFGIAKVLEALSRSTTHSVGTLQYMSPEQIDAAGVDARSDLYALGLVFYELLAGRPPFESASPRDLLNLQCTAQPPAFADDVRAGLPKGIERLVFALLEKRPDDRPADADAVLEALEPFGTADDAPVAIVRPTGKVVSAASAKRTERSHRGPESSVEVGRAPSPATARRPVSPSDTIALVERAAAPREVSWRIAVVVVFVLSLLAGGVTYLAKVASAATPEPTSTVQADG